MQHSSLVGSGELGDIHRLIVDNITELVALVDDEGTVLYASAAQTPSATPTCSRSSGWISEESEPPISSSTA